MKVSASIELVWQMATQEAIAAEFAEIEPEHFLAAMLKFAELPVEELDHFAPGAEVARELASEVQKVRQEWQKRSIDSTGIRRELRARLGKGGSPHDGGQKHRSKASRDLFDAAARLADDAGNEALAVGHVLAALLASPTPLVRELLGAACEAGPPKPVDTPLLMKYGHNLTQLAAEGKLSVVTGHKAQVRALVRTLADGGKRAVLLITDNIEAIRQLVAGVAYAIVKESVPAALKGNRIVDISALDPNMGINEEVRPQLEEALAEAARAENLWLLTPAIEPHVTTLAGDWWHNMLRAALEQGDIRMICPASSTGYLWVKDDPVWKRWASAMWLQKTIESEIPREL